MIIYLADVARIITFTKDLHSHVRTITDPNGPFRKIDRFSTGYDRSQTTVSLFNRGCTVQYGMKPFIYAVHFDD